MALLKNAQPKQKAKSERKCTSQQFIHKNALRWLNLPNTVHSFLWKIQNNAELHDHCCSVGRSWFANTWVSQIRCLLDRGWTSVFRFNELYNCFLPPLITSHSTSWKWNKSFHVFLKKTPNPKHYKSFQRYQLCFVQLLHILDDHTIINWSKEYAKSCVGNWYSSNTYFYSVE